MWAVDYATAVQLRQHTGAAFGAEWCTMFDSNASADVGRLDSLEDALGSPLATVIKLAARTLRCPAAVIALVDEQADCLRPAATYGVDFNERSLEEAICHLVVRTGRTVMIEDTRLDLRLEGHLAMRSDQYPRFSIAAPLHSARAGRVVGVLAVFGDSPHRSTGEQLKLFEDLVETAEQVLEVVEDHRASEEMKQRYRALIAPSPDAVYTIDPEGRFSSCNDATLRLTGYTRDEFMGKPFLDVVAPEDKEQVLDVFFRCMAGEPQCHRARIVRKDGGSFHGSISASRYSVQGGIEGVVGITRDITPQVVAEQQLRESETRLRLALASAHQGAWECRVESRRFYQSPELRAILGFPGIEVWEDLESWFTRIHPDDLDKAIAQKTRIIERRTTEYRMEKRLRCSDGSYRWLQCEGEVIAWDAEGRPARVIGVAADIHERKLTAEAHMREAERMAMAVKAGEVGTFDVDLATGTTQWDARSFRLFGFPPAATGPTGEAILAAVHPDDRAQLARAMADLASGTVSTLEHEHRVIWPDRSVHHLRVVGKVMTREDNSRLLVGTCWDVSKSRELQQKLSYQATHDAVTGLYNRFEFERRLEAACRSTRAAEQIHALCFIDLDRFKLVNDTAGHSAGDKLLGEIGRALASDLRTSDVVARLGGDEFGLLLMNCSADHAKQIAEEIVGRIEAVRLEWQGRTHSISASVGIAPVLAGRTSVDTAMAQADIACYAAKSAGRGRVSVYGLGEDDASTQHEKLIAAATLREAMTTGGLCLFAQPIVPVNDAGPQFFEVLVRMVDSGGKLISPGILIPAAEHYGIMGEIDRWILTEALDRDGAAIAAIPGFRLSLNLSAQSISDPALPGFITSLVKSSRLPPERLMFEITETAAVTQPEAAIRAIEALREMGCAIALDDFGTGLSSFGYLKHFRADFIKIDGSFISTLTTNLADQRIARSIHALAREFGARTIAEHVESMEILDHVRSIGIDFAQGYGIGKPQPLGDALTGIQPKISELTEVGG
ncbi:EAL domain-containing protein [Proteobacteria bacterium 005FR1]|nr:EAL domain-containing protein [Proteobacteria bacterium 005FR1]